MSDREYAKNLIDQVPESKLYYVISYLQAAAVPEEVPNAETLAAMEEAAEMAKHPENYKSYGSFAELLADLEA